MKIETAEFVGTSKKGEDAYSEDIKISGFKPNSVVWIFLSSWSFTFTYGDHPILETGLKMQRAAPGGKGWEETKYCLAQPDGTAWFRYRGFIGSEGRDNPFTFYAAVIVMGEPMP